MASRPLDGNLKSTNKDEAGLNENAENMSSHLSDDVHSLPPAQNRRILMKTDLVVLPCAVIAMTLAFLDKVSKKRTPLTFTRRPLPRQPSLRPGMLHRTDLLSATFQNAMGFAAIFGLRQDTNLQGQQYSWLGSIFYFGYLAMEFPSLWIMTKVPIGRYIGACLVLWGACICLMAACHNFAGLAVIRFLLGVFEAALLPCMLVLNSTWYRREEQPLRTALWHNTFAGVFGGILSYAIGNIKGELSTWKVRSHRRSLLISISWGLAAFHNLRLIVILSIFS